jgi:hypothetical protein
MTTPLAAAYTPSPTAVQDVYDLIVSWVGPDADKGTAAVAMSCHKDLVDSTSRLLRMAVLARFPYADEQHEPVPGKDFLPLLDELEDATEECASCGPACACEVKALVTEQPTSMLDDRIFFPDRKMAESIKRQIGGAA